MTSFFDFTSFPGDVSRQASNVATAAYFEDETFFGYCCREGFETGYSDGEEYFGMDEEVVWERASALEEWERELEEEEAWVEAQVEEMWMEMFDEQYSSYMTEEEEEELRRYCLEKAAGYFHKKVEWKQTVSQTLATRAARQAASRKAVTQDGWTEVGFKEHKKPKSSFYDNSPESESEFEEEEESDVEELVVEEPPAPVKVVEVPASPPKPATVAPWAQVQVEPAVLPPLEFVPLKTCFKTGRPLCDIATRHSGFGVHNTHIWILRTEEHGNVAVLLKEDGDVAVEIAQKPSSRVRLKPSQELQDIADGCGQRLRRQKDKVEFYPCDNTPDNVCVSAALGLDKIACLCDRIEAIGGNTGLRHDLVPPSPLSDRFGATVRHHLGLPQLPRVPAGARVVPRLVIPEMSKSKQKMIARKNLVAERVTTFGEYLYMVIRAVAKRSEWLEEYCEGARGGFKNLMETWLDDAEGARDSSYALRAILNLAQQMYSKANWEGVKLTAVERSAIEKVLAQWPCEQGLRGELDNEGFFKTSSSGCRNSGCCFAHSRDLVTPEGGAAVASFGIMWDGLRKLYHRGLERILTCVPPTAVLDKHDIPIRFKRYVEAQPVHPSLVVEHTARVAPTPVKKEKADFMTLGGLTAEEKARIVSHTTPEAEYERAVADVLKHPAVDVLRRQSDVEPEDFEDWVRSQSEKWFFTVLQQLDDIQKERLREQREEEERAEVRRRLLEEREATRRRLEEARATRNGERPSAVELTEAQRQRLEENASRRAYFEERSRRKEARRAADEESRRAADENAAFWGMVSNLYKARMDHQRASLN